METSPRERLLYGLGGIKVKVKLKENRTFNANLGDFVVMGDTAVKEFQMIFMIALDSHRQYILIDIENGKSLAGSAKTIDDLLSKHNDILRVISNENVELKEV